MLAVSPVRSGDVQECGVAGMAMEEIRPVLDMDFDFTVDDIDFGDFFLGLEDGDAFPDLEVDPAEIFTDFEANATGRDGVMDQDVPSFLPLAEAVDIDAVDPCSDVISEENTTRADVEEVKGECNHAKEVIARNAEKSPPSTTSVSEEAEGRQKCSSKHSQGKKKAKAQLGQAVNTKAASSWAAGRPGSWRNFDGVHNGEISLALGDSTEVDWTPELHRRFVQAVEQLGIDKAVPSRILEIMGIDSLTRHNIASHLQKYRSHRKHMLAREAEAVSWTQRRQMYADGGAPKRLDSNAWTVPTIGFTPPPPPPPAHPMQHFGSSAGRCTSGATRPQWWSRHACRYGHNTSSLAHRRHRGLLLRRLTRRSGTTLIRGDLHICRVRWLPA